jgi:RNA polymerase sigma-70 factor (ECF subfamily)
VLHAHCEYCNASDDYLIANMRRGEQKALEHLFDRYSELVFRVSRRILRDTGEAQDVTQEVFLQMYRAVHLYDSQRGSVRTWLLKIACNRSLDRRRYLNSRSFYAHVGVERLEARRTSKSYEPPVVLREARLEDALSRLNPPQRQTIELYCFEGLTLREIAVRMGESFSNIRHHYYRGIENLRNYLQEQMVDDNPGVSRGAE